MEDLPVLPFEKIFSYLSLEDRIRSRTVSRRWCKTIDSLKVKSLFYSGLPIGFFGRKSRFASGAFAQNFISSAKFRLFFDTFTSSILTNLKHLRLCELKFNAEDSTFAQVINSFGLEQLDIYNVGFSNDSDDEDPDLDKEFELNLPMLKSVRLFWLSQIGSLTLDAPRLQRVELIACSNLKMNLIHAESVETLVTDDIGAFAVTKLKNLKYLYGGYYSGIDSISLFNLKKLQEIHLYDHDKVSDFFVQKKQYHCTDMKIYYCGVLLNGPDDPAMYHFFSFYYLHDKIFRSLVGNPSRLADEIPIYETIPYTAIESVAPELQVTLLNRLTHFGTINVTKPVQHIQRFLDFLKSFDQIKRLRFSGDQPQTLLDRLPDYCAVRGLTIERVPSDLSFLFRLKNLNHISFSFSIDNSLIQKIFENLKFIVSFQFKCSNESNYVEIQISHRNRYNVWVSGFETIKPDLSTAIQFIMENNQ